MGASFGDRLGHPQSFVVKGSTFEKPESGILSKSMVVAGCVYIGKRSKMLVPLFLHPLTHQPTHHSTPITLGGDAVFAWGRRAQKVHR